MMGTLQSELTRKKLRGTQEQPKVEDSTGRLKATDQDSKDVSYEECNSLLSAMNNPNNAFPQSEVDGDAKEVSDQKINRQNPPHQGFDITTVMCSVIAVIAAILVVIGVTCGSSQKSSAPIHEHLLRKRVEFIQRLNAVVTQFKMSATDTRAIRAANNTIFAFLNEEHHIKPAIILLLSMEKTSPETCCLLNSLQDAVTNFYGEAKPSYGIIMPGDFDQLNDNEIKNFIEQKIKTTIEDQKKHLIIMRDVDKFPVASLSKLHPYFDHDFAPYKDVIYILTSETNLTINAGEATAKFVKRHFDISWSEYGDDHRPALLGRMATSALILIKPGEFILQKSNTCNVKC